MSQRQARATLTSRLARALIGLALSAVSLSCSLSEPGGGHPPRIFDENKPVLMKHMALESSEEAEAEEAKEADYAEGYEDGYAMSDTTLKTLGSSAVGYGRGGLGFMGTGRGGGGSASPKRAPKPSSSRVRPTPSADYEMADVASDDLDEPEAVMGSLEVPRQQLLNSISSPPPPSAPPPAPPPPPPIEDAAADKERAKLKKQARRSREPRERLERRRSQRGANQSAPAARPPLPSSDVTELLSRGKPIQPWPKFGYFENTYLGGDLAFESAVNHQRHDLRSLLSPTASRRAVGSSEQLGEMGMHLTAALSQPSLSGPQRVILQVGLQGSERYGWRRPPLSLMVIIDPSWGAQGSLDLAHTLGPIFKELSPVDRVALLSRALSAKGLQSVASLRDRLIQSTQPSATSTSAQEAGRWLERAMLVAGGALQRAAQDPHRAPGAQSVLLLCAQGCVASSGALQRASHELNLEGVMSSVISLPSTEGQALWRIASNGNGGAWQLSELSRAELSRAVRAEFERFSRVVARLLRLSVKLPKHVELVEIIGSQMLSKRAAERVKQREVAMDRRLSERLGIKANRGEDDEGVQVVIPAFYGGDQHFINLVLWVERPGEVAEVTLKYKDMVRSVNATASVATSISANPQALSPSHRALRHIVAQQLAAVSLMEALRRSDQAGVHQQLSQLAALTQTQPGSGELIRRLSRASVSTLSEPLLLYARSILGRSYGDQTR